MLDNNTMVIIFGMTSGILTLIGLTAIFVSINSQHNVQKGRELLWNIMSLPLEIDDYSNSKNANKLCHYYWLYKDIIGASSDFTKKIVSLSQFAISIVCIFWIIGTPFYYYTLSKFELIYVSIATVVSIVILLRYSWVLGKLSQISKIANLPEYDKLLDANAKLGINIHINALASIGASLKITRNDTNFSLSVGLTLPFRNLSVSPIVFAHNSENLYGDKHYMEKIYLEYEECFYINGEGYLSLGMPNIWYDLIEFSINDDIKKLSTKIVFQLDFSSQQGSSRANYLNSMEDLRDLNLGESMYLLPDSVHDHFVANKDGTMVPWGLNI